jgi:uncharacterized MAPEG superfamily protein
MMTVAFWCVLAATLLPYFCFFIAGDSARRAGTPRDNRNPRDFPNRIEGFAKRAWDAHLNSFESLPGFAAAVVIAYLAGAPQHEVDSLAVVWVLARVAYVAFYLTDKSTLRTSAQVVSLACVLGLFVIAGLNGGRGEP